MSFYAGIGSRGLEQIVRCVVLLVLKNSKPRRVIW